MQTRAHGKARNTLFQQYENFSENEQCYVCYAQAD